MAERLAAALLDTSVIVDLDRIDPRLLPEQTVISAVTLAELSAGPAFAEGRQVRALRQRRLQMVEAALDPVPFGAAAARAYGSLVAAVLEHGRQPRRRTADLMVAATAVAEGLPLLTRNPGDFAGLEDHLRVIAV